MGVLKWPTLPMISGNIFDAECQVDRHAERLFEKGFKAAAGRGVPGGKKERVMFGVGWFDRKAREEEERNPLREEGTNSFAITSFVRTSNGQREKPF